VLLRGCDRGGRGIELKWTAATACTIREGKIVKSVLYRSKEEALEAVGLGEEDTHSSS
jgi:hypothetical protein